MIQKSYEKTNEYGDFYIIPTPIGNISDITLRAIEVLKQVDIIYAEDTRTSLILLNHYEIKKPLKSCHIFNEKDVKEKIYNEIKNGKNIAIISDRGTPLISDPGYEVTKYLIERNVNIIALPGPSALLPALNMSGIDSNKFLFYGFLNSKETEAKKELESLKELKYTIVFYESPHRLLKTLNNILLLLGNRNIAICREISKKYEEIFRGKVQDAIEYCYNIKGEFVIVVEKNVEKIDYAKYLYDVKELINNGMSSKNSIKYISKKYGVSKNILYNMLEEEKR